MARSMLGFLVVTACGGQTGELGNERPLEIVDTPLTLDEVSALGFTPQEVLDRAPTTTYDGALTADEGDFGPGSLSDRLLASGPFTISALAESEAVLRQEYIDDTLLHEYVSVRGHITIVSADGAFDVAGAAAIAATGLTDAEMWWSGDGTDEPTGVMPTWVDDAVATQADGDCDGAVPFAILRPHETFATPALILNIVVEPCSSGNYAWLDLTPVE